MKNLFYSLFCIFNMSIIVNAQNPKPEIEFSKTYGGTSHDYSRMVRQLPDGGYIMAGDSRSHQDSRTDYDIQLVRTDINGNEIWSAKYGASNRDERITWAMEDAIQLLFDGNGSLTGFIIVGTVQTNTTGVDVFFLKVDVVGAQIWQRTFGGNDDDYGRVVKQVSNGDFIIVGMTFSFGVNNNDVYIIRTDASGNLLWQGTYNLTSWEDGYDILEIDNDHFLVTGTTIGSNGGAFLFKIEGSSGNPDPSFGNYDFQLCQGTHSKCGGKYYLFNNGGTGYDIAPRTGGYVVVGTQATGQDGFLCTLNSDGTPVFPTVTLPGSGENNAYVVHEVAGPGDPGFIIAGEIDGIGYGSYDFWLIKTDLSGIKIWEQTYGGSSFDWCTSMSPTQDGGLVLTGLTNSIGSNPIDFWLLKLRYCLDEDDDGYTICNGDCDDTNANINPDVSEICLDGIDNNCDGLIDLLSETTTQTVINFFDDAVLDGTIYGVNPNPGNKLQTFKNKLILAQNATNITAAINHINWCIDKSDGTGQDFIAGPQLVIFNALLQELIDNLSCSGMVFMPNLNEMPEQYIPSKNQDLENSNIEIYPNPVQNTLIIEATKLKGRTIQLKIFDTFGQLVFKIDRIRMETSAMKIDLEPLNLSNGHYVLCISDEKKMSISRFVRLYEYQNR
jgi:hypothetical protein